MSWTIDRTLCGLEPFGFHLTNVVLHGVTALLVLAPAERVLARTTRLGPQASPPR